MENVEEQKHEEKAVKQFWTDELTLEEVFGSEEQAERRKNAPMGSKWEFSKLKAVADAVKIPTDLYKGKKFTVIWNSSTNEGWKIEFQHGICGISSYANIKIKWDIETDDVCAYASGHSYKSTAISVAKSCAKKV